MYELLENMTFAEYNLWMQFFNERPIGWREDDRTYKLMRAQGMKAGPEQLFTSLAIMKENDAKATSNAVPRTGSFLHAMMMNAKGGDKPAFLKEL